MSVVVFDAERLADASRELAAAIRRDDRRSYAALNAAAIVVEQIEVAPINYRAAGTSVYRYARWIEVEAAGPDPERERTLAVLDHFAKESA